jgi:hypothetical protein
LCISTLGGKEREEEGGRGGRKRGEKRRKGGEGRKERGEGEKDKQDLAGMGKQLRLWGDHFLQKPH